jgi:hypothetical protein
MCVQWYCNQYAGSVIPALMKVFSHVFQKIHEAQAALSYPQLSQVPDAANMMATGRRAGAFRLPRCYLMVNEPSEEGAP